MERKKIFRWTVGFLVQLAAWGVLIGIAPLIVYYATGRTEDATLLLHLLLMIILPATAIYFINFYILVPSLLFKGRTKWFVFVNLVMIIVFNSHLVITIFTGNSDIPNYWIGIVTAITISYVLDICALAVTIGLRNYFRTIAIRQQLAEETQRHTEAELMWLKNQLNPHFLFNSLNNISSLIWIDANRAQNCIGDLSDLLRYAIYESQKKFVPLEKEMDFMRNYISLMSLRCNSNTEISVAFQACDSNVEIAPLLLISLIENAFKHGVSTSQPSFVKFELTEMNHELTFICENSDFHKSDKDRSGSGIGIPNMKKRLDLIYPGRYTWTQSGDGDTFRVQVTISLNQ